MLRIAGIFMNDYALCFSSSSDSGEAFAANLEQIRKKADGRAPLLVIFFSGLKNFEFYSRKFHDTFPRSTVLGATSSIEFCSCGTGEHSLSSVAFFSGMEVSSGILHNIRRFPMHDVNNVRAAFDSLDDTRNTICLEFTAAFANTEELVLDTFSSVLRGTGIPVCGSTAGAEPGCTDTLVSLDGEISDDACVFVFIRNLCGKIFLYRENIYRPTSCSFLVTDVDCDERIVYELDHRPAAAALSGNLNIPVEKLAEFLSSHPFGRMNGRGIYVTDVADVLPDGGIALYSGIYNYSKLVLLELGDTAAIWKRTTADVHAAIPKPSFTFVVNCLNRTKAALSTGRFDEFADVLRTEFGNYIGISGYGEQADFVHFNRAMLLAVFE